MMFFFFKIKEPPKPDLRPIFDRHPRENPYWDKLLRRHDLWQDALYDISYYETPRCNTLVHKSRCPYDIPSDSFKVSLDDGCHFMAAREIVESHKRVK
jgi:hypothetical protein